MNDEQLIKKCVELGAFRAACVNIADITFDPELRAACAANYCGNYGKNHGCPPAIGDAETLIAKAKSFSHALVFQTVTPLEDSYDFEGMKEAAVRHAQVASGVDLLIELPHLQLTAGGCTVCELCAGFDGEPCRHPDKAVSSLEAYCIHVAKLAGKCGMNYINGEDTVSYFAAFLF